MRQADWTQLQRAVVPAVDVSSAGDRAKGAVRHGSRSLGDRHTVTRRGDVWKARREEEPRTMSASQATLDPETGARFLQDLEFLLTPDMPDEAGPAYLLVALRSQPTLSHFDPEEVDFWVDRDGRGAQETLTLATHLPADITFSWGQIRVVDRLGVSNEYLTFGGQLAARRVDGLVVADFASPAPILTRGGHSQTGDPSAPSVAGFFAKLRAAVGTDRWVETRVLGARPLTRYAAYVTDSLARFRGSELLRAMHPGSFLLLERQERHIRRHWPLDWALGRELLTEAGMGGGSELTARRKETSGGH